MSRFERDLNRAREAEPIGVVMRRVAEGSAWSPVRRRVMSEAEAAALVVIVFSTLEEA